MKPAAEWRLTSAAKVLLLVITAISLLADCTGDKAGSPLSTKADDDPASANAAFDLTQAALDEHCISCHAAGSPNGVFDSYDALLATGLVVPGDSHSSPLCTVAQADQPPLPANLPPEVAQDICAWISAGALNE